MMTEQNKTETVDLATCDILNADMETGVVTIRSPGAAFSPHMLSSKNKPCDKCGEIVTNENWDFPVCMCKACSNDRSRWQCRSCKDNLGLEAPPYEGDFWPAKDYCDKCLANLRAKLADEMWRSLERAYEMLD